MNPRRINRWLYLTATLCVAGAIGVGVVAWRAPLQVERPNEWTDQTTIQTSARERDTGAAPSLDSFAGVWTMNLRRPLYDPPPPPPPEPPKPKPPRPLTVKLVGMASESGRSVAIFDKGRDDIVLCPVGHTFESSGGPVTLVAVDEGAVVVRFDNRDLTLELPRESLP